MRDRLVRWCMDEGGQLLAATDHLVECYKTGGTAATILMGAPGRPPTANIVYTLAPQGSDVRVQARQWMQSYSAVGVATRLPFTDRRTLARMQGYLTAMAAERPN